MYEDKKYLKYWGKARRGQDGAWECHLLPYHCLDVAAVGRLLVSASPQLSRIAALIGIDKQKLCDWLTFIFALHDIGKFSDGFQSLNPELCLLLRGRSMKANYLEKHWTTGYQFLIKNNNELFQDSEIDFLKYWYSASCGHHGRPPQSTLNPVPQQSQFPAEVKDDAINFIKEVKNILNIWSAPCNAAIDYYKILPRISWFVAGEAMLTDWIGSNQEWFPFKAEGMPLREYYENFAAKQAKTAVEKSGVLPVPVSLPKPIKEFFLKITNPTQLQQNAEQIDIEDCPQLFILEEETGRGKTEAALTLAHRIMFKGQADGIYFALPTMATANAMHKRVGETYKKFYVKNAEPSLILAHSVSKTYLSLERFLTTSNSGLSDDDIIYDCPFWIADNRKKALFAHVGVGTIDQALLAILQARHQAMRLLGLSRKVLIVDEVHACDDYVHTLLCNLLKFHAAQGGSAILLSATLPKNMRRELIENFAEGLDMEFSGILSEDYPLMTKCSITGFEETPIKRNKPSRTVKIQQINTYQDVFTGIKKVLDNGGCACWVRNTVYDAIAAYQEAGKVFGGENTILFHARFVLGDRLDIESKVLAMFGPESTGIQRKGRLVIATQVVEQSLDLDFDYVISDLAPIDLIIQRAGRLHRHARSKYGDRINGPDERGSPVMGIFMPTMESSPAVDWYKRVFSKAYKVYQHQGQLWLTAKWLAERGKFSMPDDAREMTEYVYSEDSNKDIPTVFERGDNKADGDAKAAASMANFNELNLETGYIPDGIHWIEDDSAPTRLGEPTALARLAVWENDVLIPLIRKGQGADWELSQVSVYRKLIALEDGTYKSAIEKTKDGMPDKGKYSFLIPLERKNSGWSGKARDKQNRSVIVDYDTKTGLRINKGESDEFD